MSTKIRNNYSFKPEICCLNRQNTSYSHGFHCSNENLELYLKNKALSDLETGDGVTYLVIDSEINELVAYYTLNSSAIFMDNEMSSAIHISMFAVADNYQNILYYDDNKNLTTVSDTIFDELIGSIYVLSQEVLGIKYVSLHSLEKAINFYIRNEFAEVSDEILPTELDNICMDNCTPMIRQLF